MIRLIIISSLALALSSCIAWKRAQAAPVQMPCSQVKAYVAQYGRDTVVSMARQQGISSRDIGRAMGCLKGRHAAR